jgi:hypothetical protein
VMGCFARLLFAYFYCLLIRYNKDAKTDAEKRFKKLEERSGADEFVVCCRTLDKMAMVTLSTRRNFQFTGDKRKDHQWMKKRIRDKFNAKIEEFLPQQCAEKEPDKKKRTSEKSLWKKTWIAKGIFKTLQQYVPSFFEIFLTC